MSKIPRRKWTPLEKEFDRLVRMSESPRQVQRIEGRTLLRRFEAEHGKEKLDAMWERIK